MRKTSFTALKAPSPILVTLSGMVMEVRLLQPEKVRSSILVIPPGRLIVPTSLTQSRKAATPILVNFEFVGMVMEVRLLQPEKAPLPIEVTPSGMAMEVRMLQLPKA